MPARGVGHRNKLYAIARKWRDRQVTVSMKGDVCVSERGRGKGVQIDIYFFSFDSVDAKNPQT